MPAQILFKKRRFRCSRHPEAHTMDIPFAGVADFLRAAMFRNRHGKPLCNLCLMEWAERQLGVVEEVELQACELPADRGPIQGN